jgi:hypothetical protein
MPFKAAFLIHLQSLQHEWGIAGLLAHRAQHVWRSPMENDF